MKYFDAFAGYGGFSLAIKQAYENFGGSKQKSIGEGNVGEGLQRQRNGSESLCNRTQSKKKQGHRLREWVCVGYSEIDKYAIQVYNKHFNHKNYGDITKINPKTLPDFDLFCGGFPCQAFSIAGKRGGFNDTRGTLFFDVARILAEKQPKICLLENVKGLLSHEQGATFGTILKTLDELGYDAEWQVLNAKDFGVPQNRERVFIIGHLRGTGGRQIFPIGGANEKTLKFLTAGGLKKWKDDGKNLSRNHSQGQRVYDASGIATTQSSQGGGWGAKTGLYAITRSRSNKPFKKGQIAPTVRNGDKDDIRAVLTPDRAEKRQNGRRFKKDGEPSFTLTGQDKHGVYDGCKIRRLTPLECERLMGLPDGWLDGVSDTQKYKLAGNGVVIPVVEAILNKLTK